MLRNWKQDKKRENEKFNRYAILTLPECIPWSEPTFSDRKISTHPKKENGIRAAMSVSRSDSHTHTDTSTFCSEIN